MRKRWLVYVIAAACLAALSPLIAASFNVVDLEEPGLLDWWFVLVPIQVDVALQLDSAYRIWVWMAVYFVQYLVVMAALAWIISRVRPGTRPPTPEVKGRAFDNAVSRFHLQD